MKTFEERSPRWQRNANRLDVIADAVMGLSAISMLLAALLVLAAAAALVAGVWQLVASL